MVLRLCFFLVVLLCAPFPVDLLTAQTVALGRFVHADYERNDPVASDAIIDQLLVRLEAGTEYKFVERAEVDRMLAERALSLDALGRSDGAARAGRLLPADLILSGTFFGVPGRSQAVLLEAVEPARAEVVARVRVELEGALERGHLVPLSRVNLDRIAVAAGPLLAEARGEVAKRPAQVLLKLLALPNQSGDASWDDMADRLEDALAQKTRASPAQWMLRTHRPDAATPENELRLLGLAEADPAAWDQLADHYFWGVIEPAAKGLQLRINLWDGSTPPTQLIFPVPRGTGAVDLLVADVSDAILSATREPSRLTRPLAIEDSPRVVLADMLLNEAKLVAVDILKSSEVTAPGAVAGPVKEAQRLAAAAVFFYPSRYESWDYLAALRTWEVKLYQGNTRLIHRTAALDFSMSLFPRFLVDTAGKIRCGMIEGQDARSSLRHFEAVLTQAKENYADIHQVDLLLRLRDRLLASRAVQLEETAKTLTFAAAGQEDSYRMAVAMVLEYAFDADLEPARTKRLIAQLWPRLKIATFVFDAWVPAGDKFSGIESRVRDFLLDQKRFDEARALAVLSPDELVQALALPPPPGSSAASELGNIKDYTETLLRARTRSGFHLGKMKLYQTPFSIFRFWRQCLKYTLKEQSLKFADARTGMPVLLRRPVPVAEVDLLKDAEAAYAFWRQRAESTLRGRSVNPPDARTEIPGLLRGPVSEGVIEENQSLDRYYAEARTKHAATLLASYDKDATEGYPPEVIGRLRTRVKAWLAATPAERLKTLSEQPGATEGVRRAAFNAQESLMWVSPHYLNITDITQDFKVAAERDDLPSLEYMINCGAPVEAAGSAFLRAIQTHHWPAVEYLLDKGYNPAAPWPINDSRWGDGPDSYGALALAAAAAQGRADLMDRILAYGVKFQPGSKVATADRLGTSDQVSSGKLLRASARSAADVHSPTVDYIQSVINSRDLSMLQTLLASGTMPHRYISPASNFHGSASEIARWHLQSTDVLTAIDYAAQLDWGEGVEAMMAAPSLNAEAAFERWPYARAKNPAIRAMLLRASLQLDPAASVPGIDLACAIAADDVTAVAAAWKNPVARRFRPRFGQSPLAFAIVEKHPAVARYLVEHGASLDDFDERGSTPLAHAAILGDVGIIRYLVAKGASIDLQRGNGAPPLYYALCERNEAAALALLELGASAVEPPSLPDLDPLSCATLKDLPKVVDRLLARGANPRSIHAGMSIFFPAARSNNPDLIQRFVDLGCDLSQRSAQGWTPLVSAVRWGAPASTAKLLDLGLSDPLAADVIVSLNRGWNLRFGPHPDELKTLHYKPDYHRCLEIMDERGQVTASPQAQERIFWGDFINKTKAEVAEFLKKGGDVNFRAGPATPLQRAASVRTFVSHQVGNTVGRVDWVLFLLEHGADVEATGQDWADTPLALGLANPEVVGVLLEHKAKTDRRTIYGLSILALAIGDRQTLPATVRLLLDHGALIDEEARECFEHLKATQPERIPLLTAVLTPQQLSRLRGGF